MPYCMRCLYIMPLYEVIVCHCIWGGCKNAHKQLYRKIHNHHCLQMIKLNSKFNVHTYGALGVTNF